MFARPLAVCTGGISLWALMAACALLLCSCAESSDPAEPSAATADVPSAVDSGEQASNASSERGHTGEQEGSEPTHSERVWPPPRDGCNGHASLCDRAFPQVVFPGTHNSMSNDEDGWVAPNQNRNLRAQLIDGIRVFLLDTYVERGELLLCHAFCVLGKRPLVEALEEFRSFLEANPGEVITFIFEDYISADQTTEAIETAGLLPFVYTHEAAAPWPTLGEMIEADTRLVVTAQSAGPPPAWLHNVWDVGWDTPYSFSSVEEFSCRANRGSPGNELFLVNHWVLDPVALAENAVLSNAYETLMARVDDCEGRWNRLPTFLAVDFHDVGDLFEVVDVLNGVRDARP